MLGTVFESVSGHCIRSCCSFTCCSIVLQFKGVYPTWHILILSYWHLPVSMVIWMLLVQCRLWLGNPMWDLHSLPHTAQAKTNPGRSVWLWASLLLLSLSTLDCWASVSSRLDRLSYMVTLQSNQRFRDYSFPFVQGLQVFLANVFVAQLGSAYGAFSLG